MDGLAKLLAWGGGKLIRSGMKFCFLVNYLFVLDGIFI